MCSASMAKLIRPPPVVSVLPYSWLMTMPCWLRSSRVWGSNMADMQFRAHRSPSFAVRPVIRSWWMDSTSTGTAAISWLGIRFRSL